MEVGEQAWDLSQWGAVESSLQGLPEGKLRQSSDQGPEKGKERPQETRPSLISMWRSLTCRRASHCSQLGPQETLVFSHLLGPYCARHCALCCLKGIREARGESWGPLSHHEVIG